MIEALAVPGATPLHALRPHTKVVSLVLFVLAVVSTPREVVFAYVAYAAIVVALARLARLPLRTLARRLSIELPFLAFALALPFASSGERTSLLGLVDVSRPGLWAAWGIVAKATIGLAAAVVVVATTPAADLLRGLQRLRVPGALTAIATGMVRYLDLIAGELRRLQIARVSRGDDARWLGRARALAATVGALFVRTFERGERVHLAMSARGWTGTMPVLDAGPATPREWATVLAVPLLAAAISATAWGSLG